MDPRSAYYLVGIILIPFLMVLVPLLIGQWYGSRQIKKMPELHHVPLGSITGTAFGLLAFLLAFTFQIAASRYDARKKLLLDEVTSIRTVYLRAGLLPEPFSTNTRKLITEYVNLRVDLTNDISKLDYTMSRSYKILNSLWNETTKMTMTTLSPAISSTFALSVINLIDYHNQRVSINLEYRMPLMVFWALFFVSFFCLLLLGYQFGIAAKGNFQVFTVLALVFTTVVFLILILDNPRLSRINQKPLYTLQQQLQQNVWQVQAAETLK